MNKKIIAIVVALLVVVGIGSYFASQSIEAEVEEFIRSEIAKTPIKVENVDFSASSGTLTLTHISFEDTVGKVVSHLTIDSAKLEGFNEEILDPKTEDLLVFEDLFLENVVYTATIEGQTFADSKVASIHIRDYRQNIMKLWEEMKKDNTSEAFYTAALSHAYEEVKVKNYALTMFEPFVPETQTMTLEEMVCDAADFLNWDTHPNGKPFSISYKNGKIETPSIDMLIDKMEAKNILMPHPSLYTLIMNNAFDLLNNDSPFIGQSEFLEKMRAYALGETALFENLEMEGMRIIPKEGEVKEILGDTLSVGKMAITLEMGNVLSFSFLCDALSMSAKMIYPELEPEYVPIVQAFIGDTLSFDLYTKHALNVENNEYFAQSKLSIANLASANIETEAVGNFKGEPLERVYQLVDTYDDLKYKKIVLSYDDLGLLPLIGQVAVKETRLPLDALLPMAKDEIQNFSQDLEMEMAKEKAKLASSESMQATQDLARTERTYVAVQKIADMLLKMLEKPGSFTAQLTCKEPMHMRALGAQVFAVVLNTNHEYKEIDFDLEVKQGEKTFKEATPQELLAK